MSACPTWDSPLYRMVHQRNPAGHLKARKHRARSISIKLMRSVLTLLCWSLISWAALPRASAGPVSFEPPPAGFDVSFDELYDQGFALFQKRNFAAARVELTRALALSPDDSETLLMLGIASYRTADLAGAEQALARARRLGSADIQDSALVFLGLVHEALGATDQAHAELREAGFSRSLGGTATDLMKGNYPHRLSGALTISPEFDGNVPLTPNGTYITAPSQSVDGDVLFVGSLTFRPVPRIGLYLNNTLSYRQQFRLSAYNLLLDTTTLRYVYFGDRHRLRAGLSFNYAMLGGTTLFLDGSGKAAYRLRLWSKLGIGATYEGRYRNYQQTDYQGFTGQTHSLAGELSWGLAPEPVSVAIGYQGIREQLVVPPAVTASDGTVYQPDFRAWAHGPTFKLRAQLHKRVELVLSGWALRRAFDRVDPKLGQRLDWYVNGDLSLEVECKSWLNLFFGSTVIYNQSTDTGFTYIKPLAYAGVSGSFAAF